MIDHLAHEMRTPGSIIDAALQHTSKQLANGKTNVDRSIKRCRRNLTRLVSLQEKIIDILNYRFNEDKQRMTWLIESFFSLTEEVGENNPDTNSDILQNLLQRMESIYFPSVKNMCPGRISACDFIDDISGCVASGGSTFTVRFPSEKFMTVSIQAFYDTVTASPYSNSASADGPGPLRGR